MYISRLAIAASIGASFGSINSIDYHSPINRNGKKDSQPSFKLGGGNKEVARRKKQLEKAALKAR